MIRYPEALKKGDTIGIPAPSSGVTGALLINKLNFAKKQLESLGYALKEFGNIRSNINHTSDTKENRAEAFMNCYLDPEVKAIIPPWGGEFLMEILPLLDYKVLKESKPKWIMGFSDTSTLLFTLTGKINIATVHGPNLMDFGQEPVDASVLKSLTVLSKSHQEDFTQNALRKYQSQWLPLKKDVYPSYHLDTPVRWQSLNHEDDVHFKGRFYGGNLDVLCKIIGTPYDRVNRFNEAFKDDGVIWYFESCEMQAPDIYRSLWQMKMRGWFKEAKGFLFGRADGLNENKNFTLEIAYQKALKDLDVPIIYNADIGHLPPQITLVNGAYGEVHLEGFKGQVKQVLK